MEADPFHWVLLILVALVLVAAILGPRARL